MLVSKTKKKLRDGKPVFGIGLHTNDVFIADIIGKAGFDYILIDGQHGPLDPKMLYEMVNGLGATDSDVVVRVGLQRALDDWAGPGLRRRRRYRSARRQCRGRP